MRPCPFCGIVPGERLTLERLGTFYAVSCSSCGATGAKAKTEEEALKLWDRRKKEVKPKKYKIAPMWWLEEFRGEAE